MDAFGRWILIAALVVTVGALTGCANESLPPVPSVDQAQADTEVADEPLVDPDGEYHPDPVDDYQADVEYESQVAFGDEVTIEFRMVDYSSIPDGVSPTDEMDDTLPAQPGTLTVRLISAEVTRTVGDRTAYPEGRAFLAVRYEYLGSSRNPSGLQPGMMDVTGPTASPLLVVRSPGRESLLIGDSNLDGLMGGAYMNDWGDFGFLQDEWRPHAGYTDVELDAQLELAFKYVGMDGEPHYILMETE